MNQNNTSHSTSTFTHPAIVPSHGKISAVSYSEAMDVDQDGQRIADRKDNGESIETALEGSDRDVPTSDIPEEPVAKLEATAAEVPTPVLDRPREGDVEASQSSTPMPSLPQIPHPPPLTKNLLSLYGLDSLQESVARFDPITGEKNKLRKSYEGHLKTLRLAGKNTSVKHEEGKGHSLLDLSRAPEEDWQNTMVRGKDVHKGLSADTLAKLDKAMQLQPGQLPNNDEWEKTLGYEKAKPIDHSARPLKSSLNASAQANGPVNGNVANAEAIRPKREGRKRRYDERSFEGYGEGFVDDELDMGYSSGDTQFSRRSNPKKRKKDYGNSPTGFGDRNNSFSAGMVGVGAYMR